VGQALTHYGGQTHFTVLGIYLSRPHQRRGSVCWTLAWKLFGWRVSPALRAAQFAEGMPFATSRASDVIYTVCFRAAFRSWMRRPSPWGILLDKRLLWR